VVRNLFMGETAPDLLCMLPQSVLAHSCSKVVKWIS
jgi:hypothetical protein